PEQVPALDVPGIALDRAPRARCGSVAVAAGQVRPGELLVGDRRRGCRRELAVAILEPLPAAAGTRSVTANLTGRHDPALTIRIGSSGSLCLAAVPGVVDADQPQLASRALDHERLFHVVEQPHAFRIERVCADEILTGQER